MIFPLQAIVTLTMYLYDRVNYMWCCLSTIIINLLCMYKYSYSYNNEILIISGGVSMNMYSIKYLLFFIILIYLLR